jgi:hypothetical protein
MINEIKPAAAIIAEIVDGIQQVLAGLDRLPQH